jgi:hypothetical protein
VVWKRARSKWGITFRGLNEVKIENLYWKACYKCETGRSLTSVLVINENAILISVHDTHVSKRRKRNSHVWADKVEIHDMPAQSLARPPQ